MRYWTWMLFGPFWLSAGCVATATAPAPPLDAAAPARTGTATFGLG